MSDKHLPILANFAQKGVRTAIPNDVHTLTQDADIIVLAVKPQVIDEVAPTLVSLVADKLILSIMAGVSTQRLS